MKRLIAILLLGFFTPVVADEPAAHRFDETLRVERLAPGVWRHVSVQERGDYGPVPANGLIVVGADSAALVDTPWTAAQTAQLFDWVETTFGVEIGAVVPTHSHEDCAGGLAEAHRRGARSYAHVSTAELLRAAEAVVPTETFDDRRTVDLGGVTLELRYFGAGHTRDNIVVWVQPSAVLFGGCLVKAEGGSAGYIDEADLVAWPETVRAVLAAYPEPRLVVPGHGKPGDDGCLRYTIEFTGQLGRD